MRQPRRSGDAGLSLVEVLIAAGVLATMLAGLAQLLAISGRLALASSDLTRGTLIAAQTLEALRAAGPLVAHAGADTVDAAGVPLGEGAARRGAYTRRWTLTPVAAGVWQIEVVVAPGDAPGAPPAAGTPVRLLTWVGEGVP